MSRKGIDIAWARPSIATIKATGATWVARYLSNDDTKNLHASEVHDYTAAGIAIVTVWETTTGRSTQGYAAGVADAHAAEAQRRAVGLPANQVIHFAVDMDTTWSTVDPYFAGAASVLGHDRVGPYGGIRVIEGAHTAGYRWLWQADAWSNGQWHPAATIRQTGGTCLGGAADYDEAMVDDFGQYPRPTTPEADVFTPQDAQLAAKTLLATTIQSQFRKDPKTGKPLDIPVAEFFEYGDAHFDETRKAIADVTAQTKANGAGLTEVKQALAKLGVPQLTPEQVAALAKQVAPVLEELLVPALLAAVGHALDGTKPAAAVAQPTAAATPPAPAVPQPAAPAAPVAPAKQ